MDFLEYKGYKGSVEYSREDDCLFGKVQGLHRNLITYEGNSVAELEADFRAGVDDYLAGCAEDSVLPEKPYSGRLNLRMTSDLHSQVAALAAKSGRTINEFINVAIANEVARETAIAH